MKQGYTYPCLVSDDFAVVARIALEQWLVPNADALLSLAERAQQMEKLLHEVRNPKPGYTHSLAADLTRRIDALLTKEPTDG